MKLRDQPVLDKFQDEIFRLPLDSRMLLLGPPGTGKTTTLIRRSNKRWYLADEISQSDTHPLELDMLLLSRLKGARSLLSSRDVQRNLHNPFWTALQPVQEAFRNQIFVDEAMDFSPVQLACMSALSRPGISSFFACGDFNQRLSSWGTRSVK